MSAQANPSPAKIGRYEIVGELGKGAMGIVYKAMDPMIGRTVAMKTMRVDVHGMEADEMLKRFQNEARAAGVLQHPNIVTIYDAGEQDGLFYIAMEFIEGVTLHSLIIQNRVLPVEQVIDYSRQICAGLDQAHAHGVIHRDVKPANIMIMPDGLVKIMDFGIAKAGGGLTSAGQVLGTPNYMSPEQVKGRTLDGRSDLFSFGVMLYEMVTGEKPFTGQNVTTIIYKIVNENPIPPRELDVTIHPGLSAVITKALSKSPDERYQKGADLVKDLANYKALAGGETAASSTGTLPVTGLNENVSDKTVVFDSGSMAKASSGSMTAPAAPAPAAPVPSASASAAAAPAAAATPAVSPAVKAFDSTVDLAKKKVAPAVAAAKKQPKLAMVGGIVLLVILALGGGVMYLRHRSAVLQAELEQQQREAASAKAAQEAQAHVDQAIQSAPSPAVTEPAPDQAATPAKPETTKPAAKTPATKPNTKANPQQAKNPAPVPATPTPAPQPAATTGELQVSSNPAGAQLQVDGAIQQSSPYTFRNLTPGQHTVVVSKAGFATETRKIDVAVGKTTPLVVNLNAVPTATISTASEPEGAHILIDGKDTGKVTPATITVDPGEHKIILRKDGFKDATMSTPALKQGAGFDFRPFLQAGKNDENPFKKLFGGVPAGMGAVNLRTTPKGATILMNGFSAPKTTPYKLPLDPGVHQITIKLDGYKPVTKTVTIEKGKTQDLEITLEKQ